MEQYWSRFADNYDSKQSFVVGSALIDLVNLKLSGQKNLGHVLELGCGNGGYTSSIVCNSETVTATDYSQEMIDEIRKRFKGNSKIIVEQADCHKTRFSDETFDTVVMANLIHIIADPERVIEESFRVLKPKGQLIITSFTTEKMFLLNKIRLLFRYRKTFGALPAKRRSFVTKTLTELLQRKGFLIVESVLLGSETRSLYIHAAK
jgi:ubiquinone/menaquinone biosynthesis C-methylase UbiE